MNLQPRTSLIRVLLLVVLLTPAASHPQNALLSLLPGQTGTLLPDGLSLEAKKYE